MTITRYVRNNDAVASVLVLTSGFVAAWAYAGALGLAGGGIDLGSAATQRLPFDSPVFAGVALLLVVAVPMTAAAVAVARGERRAPELAMAAGTLLIGWIIAQLLIIHVFSWLQPVSVVFGAAVPALGMALRSRAARRR
ncbi:hypothetical protein H0264_24995 [Nocardia huaxiensis]|uniref:Uncharacterized protein n=1 Tax=Nocardia huaxiensis TaxID=2755382 RepID=A0A7D6ZEV7_9NOCA|nr:hypothetical protein [Nocardia huaxiensis]QLY28587.1 hypothetical protein H0264_24995 [Nocardia huaxiensis]